MRYLLASLALIVLCASVASGHSAMNRFWGEVPVDMTISGDVLVTKPLTIPEGVTLTIEAGTFVRFEDYDKGSNRIVVRGRLVALGTKDEPVSFMTKDPGKGSWRGIVVEPGGGGEMANCIIEGAAKGVDDPSGGMRMQGVEVR